MWKKILGLGVLCTLTAPLWTVSAGAATIHVMGSTTVLPVVSTAAKAYHKKHPNVVVTVSGGGSGVGIASIIQGTATIGMASRLVTIEEQEKLAGSVDVITIAQDAVAIVVSKAVYVGGVQQLSLHQIADIYRGKIHNWKEVGGPDARILVIDKEASRGTRHIFASIVLGDKHARAAGASIISGSNNEEQALVARSNSAIGMLSNAWLNDAVRGIAIGEKGHAIPPSIKHVRDGTYPLRRGLHVLLPKKADAQAKAFVAYLLSLEGQSFVKQSGYLPVR
ncbi:MAG: phosphate ABC transporter substrate-binding protein [Mariprofundaceae bacterium]